MARRGRFNEWGDELQVLPASAPRVELRWQGGWMPILFANIALGWAVAVLLLAARWLDIWQMVLPANFPIRPWPGLFELAGESPHHHG
ncbi:MAG TPA: hypothetical protein VMT03_18400 [Polyangia bacterium]|nr:hypothetical protein [Polyangia bacterium]